MQKPVSISCHQLYQLGCAGSFQLEKKRTSIRKRCVSGGFATSTPSWLLAQREACVHSVQVLHRCVVSVNLLAEGRFPIGIVARVNACGRGSN